VYSPWKMLEKRGLSHPFWCSILFPCSISNWWFQPPEKYWSDWIIIPTIG
jgi:hypothetical protein